MSKDQRRGNREAKKPKTIKLTQVDPATGKMTSVIPTAVKVKH